MYLLLNIEQRAFFSQREATYAMGRGNKLRQAHLALILVSPFYKFIICKYETTSKSELVLVLWPSMLKSNSRIGQIYLLSISREEQWGELVPFYWNVTYVYLRYQYSKQRQTDQGILSCQENQYVLHVCLETF